MTDIEPENDSEVICGGYWDVCPGHPGFAHVCEEPRGHDSLHTCACGATTNLVSQ